MTTDDYTDPTKWMELPPQQFPQTDFDRWKPYIPPASAGLLFIHKEFICCQHEPIDIPAKPKPQSPGESGFDIED